MPDGADPQIEAPILRELFAYWQSRCLGRPFPSRADVDPMAIPALLPHLFLLDVEHGRELRFRIRLSGTFIDTVFFRDGRHRYLNDHAVNRRDPARLDPYRAVVATGRPSATRTSFVDDQRRQYEYERLLLPLAVDDPARVDMILGGLAFSQPFPSPSELAERGV